MQLSHLVDTCNPFSSKSCVIPENIPIRDEWHVHTGIIETASQRNTTYFWIKLTISIIHSMFKACTFFSKVEKAKTVWIVCDGRAWLNVSIMSDGLLYHQAWNTPWNASSLWWQCTVMIIIYIIYCLPHLKVFWQVLEAVASAKIQPMVLSQNFISNFNR